MLPQECNGIVSWIEVILQASNAVLLPRSLRSKLREYTWIITITIAITITNIIIVIICIFTKILVYDNNNNNSNNKYILLDVWLYSIAEYFYKLCRILASPRGESKYKQRVKILSDTTQQNV